MRSTRTPDHESLSEDTAVRPSASGSFAWARFDGHARREAMPVASRECGAARAVWQASYGALCRASTATNLTEVNRRGNHPRAPTLARPPGRPRDLRQSRFEPAAGADTG